MSESNSVQNSFLRNLTALLPFLTCVEKRTVSSDGEAINMLGVLAEFELWVYLDDAQIPGNGANTPFEKYDYDSLGDSKDAFAREVRELTEVSSH